MTVHHGSIKTLIVVPTYNERDNAPRMVEAIFALGLDADVLFIDDASPDGTGALLDQLRAHHPRLLVRHRFGKQGIGSAHLDGIAWAYENGYQCLVTLDGDFSHSPAEIPEFLRAAVSADVVVGSRWTSKHSLPGWNLFRRTMTGVGHLLTRTVLGLPYDATGAFRAYRLDRIPRALFALVRSRSYSFFFESLFILHRNACRIEELPIVLPARTYGSSKMTTRAAVQSVQIMAGIAWEHRRRPESFHLAAKPFEVDPTLHDPQQWGPYWQESRQLSKRVYTVVASLYRRLFIRPRLHRVLRTAFGQGSQLLHAGCGGGEVDQGLHARMRITALDISADALRLYQQNNPAANAVRHGDILSLPYADSSFDGYYSLGVIEHFTDDRIRQILDEAFRVLRPGGRMVLFWPHATATSVHVLALVHRLISSGGLLLHPAEVSLLRSREMAERCLVRSGFALTSYAFGAGDLRIQAAIVGQRGS